jgi:hypothetical protein
VVSLTVAVNPSWVEIALDTRPPKLQVSAPHSITPPATWVVVVSADEDIGGAEFVLADSLGIQSVVGYEAVDIRTLRISVPSDAIPVGPLSLRGSVWDDVGNLVTMTAQSFIQGGQTMAFLASLDIGGAFNADLVIERVYDGELEITVPFDAILRISRG